MHISGHQLSITCLKQEGKLLHVDVIAIYRLLQFVPLIQITVSRGVHYDLF